MVLETQNVKNVLLFSYFLKSLIAFQQLLSLNYFVIVYHTNNDISHTNVHIFS